MLIARAGDWIARLREQHRADGQAIPIEFRQTLARFFPQHTLDRVRLRTVDRIPNPDFYADLVAQRRPVPIDFSDMLGLTLFDTVLVSRDSTSMRSTDYSALLFHEMVHVVQYEHLGLNRFVSEYVNGWAQADFDYYCIPLEQQAYSLEKRFRDAPTAEFSVREEVQAAFA